jgi:drug/metabolite transporter (DMT)-like permease
MTWAGLGEGAALAAASTWAVGSLLFARIGVTVSAPAMNLGKCLSAGALLSLTAVALDGLPQPSARALGLLAASGLAGLTVGDTAYFGAIVRLGVPRAILLLSTAPILATLGGVLALGERPSPRAWLGMAIALAGVLLVLRRPGSSGARPTGDPRPDGPAADESEGHGAGSRPHGGEAVGLALGVLGAVGQATGSVLSRAALVGDAPPTAVQSAAFRLAVGATGLLVVAGVAGRARSLLGELKAPRAAVRIAAASLVGTYCGLWLAQYGLGHASSTGVASTLLATSPVFAVPLAHLTGAERATQRSLAGSALAVAGIALLLAG